MMFHDVHTDSLIIEHVFDCHFKDTKLHGHAYAHPKLGEGPVRSSSIVEITYDARATAHVETKNTVYAVGPTGWKVKPSDHPFNQ